MDSDPIREGCAIYVGLFVWIAVVLGAISLWGVPDSAWASLVIFGPLAVAWIAVWIARRISTNAEDE